MTYNEFVSLVVLGNPVALWAQALCIGGLGFATLLSARGYLVRSFRNYKETPTVVDDVGMAAVARIRSAYLFLLALFAGGALILTFSPNEQRVFEKVLMVVTLLQIGLCVQAVIDVFLKEATPEGLGKGHRYMASGVLALVRIIIWFTVLMLGLDTFGFDVMAAVTTFGIGGIAIALAVQGFLKDMFASFAILLDRPFNVGDYITFDDKEGTVERIGIKTTRLRTLAGEELVLNNADLLESRIHNHRRTGERRVTLRLYIGYEVPTDVLRALPGQLQQTIEKHDKAAFRSAVYTDYTPQGLGLHVLYRVDETGYRAFNQIRHEVNLDVHELLTKLDVPFGYTTQRILDHVRPHRPRPTG